jgi:hypothetical protein
MRPFVVCLAVLASLTACDGSSSTSATGIGLELSIHKAQWAKRGFHDYAYDYANAGPIGAANVHVTVRADTVESLIDATTGMAPAFPLSVPTIDALFGIADAALGAKHTTVKLEFDSQFGYPTLVSAVDDNPGGPFVARVSNLQPTQ